MRLHIQQASRSAAQKGWAVLNMLLSLKRGIFVLVLMAASTCKVGVVFDMQFAGLMHQKDLGKIVYYFSLVYANKCNS